MLHLRSYQTNRSLTAMNLKMILSIPLILMISIPGCMAEICQQSPCEYNFTIANARTMTWFSNDLYLPTWYNVELQGRQLITVENSLRKAGRDPYIGRVVPPEEVVTAGGHLKNIITINGQYPGPAVEVMEGDEVVMKFTNHLKTAGITIHMHGIHMRGTPWMDGVAYVQQCPIPPRQSFTYRFYAYPAGTHWYHAHHENQRLDGLYGMLIVHKQREYLLPEHHAFITDWWHMEAETMEIMNPAGTGQHGNFFERGTGEMTWTPTDRDYDIDGVYVAAMRQELMTTIINGRGLGNDGEEYPLWVFNVEADQRTRIRLAHSGCEYPYYISVDEHKLWVVASDGYEIEPVQVDKLQLFAGETFDIELEPDQAIGNYWFRAFTVRAGTNYTVNPDENEYGNFAIVRYDGAPEEDPTTEEVDCGPLSRCTVFNCPYTTYPASWFTDCITFSDARSTWSTEELNDEFGIADEDYDEYFYSWNMGEGPMVNGVRFIEPIAPLTQLGDGPSIITPCDEECSSGCMCTQVVELPYERTIQMVWVNLELGAHRLNYAHHPIHSHGHSFAVLKIGYAEQDPVTGRWIAPNADVACNDQRCSRPDWAGDPPSDLNQIDPPVKDNIVIPARGYAVVRFRTTNPGWWFFHCHTDQHVLNGMAIVFLEAPEMIPDVPDNWPVCRDYVPSDDADTSDIWESMEGEEHVNATNVRDNNDGEFNPSDDLQQAIYISWIGLVSLCLFSVLLGAFIAAIPLYCYYRNAIGILDHALKTKDIQLGFANQNFS